MSNENGELSKRLSSLETALANSEEKCGNLEASCSRLESQLSDSIKLQDRYGRELQLEKRNLLKRNQEYEELKQSVRQYEQKCDELEVKLDEKLSTVAVLKSQLVQKEADLNRIDYEYQKLKSLNKQNSQQQAPYMTNLIKEASSQESKPQSLQIRNHMKHMSNPNLHHLSVETHLNTKTQTSASNYNLSPNEKSTATRINLPVHHNNNFESDLNKYAKYYDGTSSTSSISPSRQPSGLTSSLLNRLAAGGENNQPVNGDDHTTSEFVHDNNKSNNKKATGASRAFSSRLSAFSPNKTGLNSNSQNVLSHHKSRINNKDGDNCIINYTCSIERYKSTSSGRWADSERDVRVTRGPAVRPVDYNSKSSSQQQRTSPFIVDHHNEQIIGATDPRRRTFFI